MTTLDGATNEPAPNTRFANAGEFAAAWNTMTPERREQWFEVMQAQSDTSLKCVIEDHDGLLQQRALAPRITETELNRFAQYVYSSIGERQTLDLQMAMTAKPDLVEALREALGHINIEVVETPARWDITTAHTGCDTCTTLADIGRSVLELAVEMPEATYERGEHWATVVRP